MGDKTIQLRFKKIDKNIFDAVKSGKKKIETRAATRKFINIKEGDTIRLVCGKGKLDKKVKSVELFKTISVLCRKYKPSQINPSVKSIQDLEKMYYSFPGYKEKIRKHGLIAIKLA